jgi:hypothetical protein
MKFYQQGYNECFPTALGCYLEREPGTIIKEILEPEFGALPWWLVTRNRGESFTLFKNKINQFLQVNVSWLPIEAYVIQGNIIRQCYEWPEQMPKGKRGFLTLTGATEIFPGRLLANGSRHIIAFDGEMIYDTNQSKPWPYRSYLNYLSIRSELPRLIDGIYVEPKGARK